MKHIKILTEGNLSKNHGGCGECATGCQSACKTSNPVVYQRCEAKARGIKQALRSCDAGGSK